MSLDRPAPRRRRGFRFEEMWFEHPECKDLFRRARCESNGRSHGSQLWLRLGNYRRILIKWSKVSFENNITEMRRTTDRLKEIGGSRPNQETKEEEVMLKNRILTLWRREELYWKQRSRVKWLTEGDRKTTFFHLTMTTRRRRNHISRIMDNRGWWITREEDIQNEIFQHFKVAFEIGNLNRDEDIHDCVP